MYDECSIFTDMYSMASCAVWLRFATLITSSVSGGDTDGSLPGVLSDCYILTFSFFRESSMIN
jgi:hypothetical protein